MKCPFCQAADTRVIDTRSNGEGFTIRRRRECLQCDYRFTTYEQIAETALTVIKKNGTRIAFDRNKIRAGVETACYKRPVSGETIEDLVARIEAAVTRLGEPEVNSWQIGELVMEELRRLDQVAYV